MNPAKLPIYELRAELTNALKSENRIIIEAPTGSGKSTQVPQMALDCGNAGTGEVVVLQPRRLAARLLAKRVAFERNEPLGGEVGYQVRMESHVSARTQIRYVTEGILLRQFLSDPELRGISTIIFDEFHERHIYGDITLARALHLQQIRPVQTRPAESQAVLQSGRKFAAPSSSRLQTFPVSRPRRPHRQPTQRRRKNRKTAIAPELETVTVPVRN